MENIDYLGFSIWGITCLCLEKFRILQKKSLLIMTSDNPIKLKIKGIIDDKLVYDLNQALEL